MRLTNLFDQEYVKPTPQAGDIFEFELDDNTVIETTIAGVDSEGNVELYLDETAINMIEQRGMLAEHIVKVKGGYELKSKHGNKNLGKYPTKAGAEKRERQVQYFKHMSESVEHSPVASALTRRIMNSRVDLLAKYGPSAVMQAIDSVADWVGDVDEIGSSDVSAWIRSVERELGHSDISEASDNVGRSIKQLYKKFYDLGDDELDHLHYNAPIFAQYWDEYEGDLDSIIAEVDPKELLVIKAELETELDNMGLDEAAPAALRWGAGAALGTVAGSGGVIMGSMLGGIFAPIVGGIAAWNAAKIGMDGADAIWDWAAKKLGGGHNEQDFAFAHIRAAAAGKDTFEYRNQEYPVTLPKTDVNKAVQAVKQVAESKLEEAKYHGKEVSLGKPVRGGPKKFYVYVRDPATKNIKKVNFGDPNMRIKKSSPKHRKSFRARHNCANPGPRTKARYWSCRKW